MHPTPNTLKLPAALIGELGGPGEYISHIREHIYYADQVSDSLQKRQGSRAVPQARKDRRKAERAQRKQRQVPPIIKHTKFVEKEHFDSLSKEERGGEQTEQQRVRTARGLSSTKTSKPKSILKKTAKPPFTPEEHSPSPKPSTISQSLRERIAQDDAEIAFLEKKLGLKGKKSLPKSFADDGLDELLAGVDSLIGLDEGDSEDSRSNKRQREEENEWLVQKRRKASAAQVHHSAEGERDDSVDSDQSLPRASESDDDKELITLSDSETDVEGDYEDENGDDEDVDTDAEFGGFDSDIIDDEPPIQKRVRENPYVAPKVAGGSGLAKYVPPSLRKASTSDNEDLTRLRRQMQGLLNRLTEANLISILGDIETLYRTNARQHVTSTLVDLLLTSVCEPTALPDTLIILPAGFIAAVYKIIGTDFGAHIIQRTVELFDSHYEQARIDTTNDLNFETSKETSNLMNLLSELYNFQVVGGTLLFDYIRLFLTTLSELNAELLLKIIRTSGPQLRQEDPSSLRDIVSLIRPAVARIGEANMSVRTKFMIETINDLKNNKMKTGAAASAVVSEHTVRMKRLLGSLNTRNIKGGEPLRVGLKDIQDSDKKGKWWLVGASWAGKDSAPGQSDDTATQIVGNTQDNARKLQAFDPDSADLAQLAREQRMNTDIRRAIFITIMSAADFQDAYVRLLRLKLKKVQELEIPKVLIHCAGAETGYNPYYTLIAKRLCSDKKLKMAFQFSLWDLFKRMGAIDDEDANLQDPDDDDTLDTRHVVNLAKMYGNLIADGSLSLTVLKNLDMSYLPTKTKSFLEILLITVFLQSQRQAPNKRDEQAVTVLIERIRSTPGLIRGLQYFIREVVTRTDVAGGNEERATVKWACRIAGGFLDGLAMKVIC